MEDLVEDCNVEIDEEYEFDASQFFDFTRPEVDSEIEEVERWFDVSGDYPNSPFIVKLDLEKILPAQGVGKSSKLTKSISNSSDTDSSSIKHGLPPSKKNAKEKGLITVEGGAAKTKSKAAHKLSQPRNAKFMEPTASHLAKKNSVHDKQRSSQLSASRLDRTQTKLDQKKSCIVSEVRATKRQKLETGFLKKGSYLRHKFSMSHKSSNKVTIPRELELGTLQRSLSRRSKSSCASSETDSQISKSPIKSNHSSNAKTLEARSLPRPRKSKIPLTEFQEFHFKTTERANYHSWAKEIRSSGGESPLSEEFSKLSVGTKSKKKPVSDRRSSASSKSSGRSSRGSFQSESWGANQHCGARMRPHQPNITRSLDIR